jgi:hypothetical protein
VHAEEDLRAEVEMLVFVGATVILILFSLCSWEKGNGQLFHNIFIHFNFLGQWVKMLCGMILCGQTFPLSFLEPSFWTNRHSQNALKKGS